MSNSRNIKDNTNNINSIEFKLPSLENSAIIFRERLFTRELLPLELDSNNNTNNRIKVNCTSCNYSNIVKWPINTSNLKSHYNYKYKDLVLLVLLII